jgi:hypothetical protein
MQGQIKRLQSKNWWFTVHEPLSLPRGARYLLRRREIDENGVPSYRGFVQMVNKKRQSEMKVVFPLAHLEAMTGTVDDAISYFKMNDDWEEFGEKPTRRGERNDLNKTTRKDVPEADDTVTKDDPVIASTILISDQQDEDMKKIDHERTEETPVGDQEPVVHPTPARKRRNKQLIGSKAKKIHETT